MSAALACMSVELIHNGESILAGGSPAAPPLWQRDDVLFIGTRFSNLYTAVDTPA